MAQLFSLGVIRVTIMLPLIVFLVMLVPFLWAIFLSARLGWSMKQQRIMDRLSLGSGRHLWPQLFTLMPEAKSRLKAILLWVGISAIWWVVVMLAVYIYISRVKQ